MYILYPGRKEGRKEEGKWERGKTLFVERAGVFGGTVDTYMVSMSTKHHIQPENLRNKVYFETPSKLGYL